MRFIKSDQATKTMLIVHQVKMGDNKGLEECADSVDRDVDTKR
jgi:hypothetical protein